MFKSLKILLSNKKRILKLLDIALLSNDIVFFEKIISSRNFKKYIDYITCLDLIEKYIYLNRIDVIQLIIENDNKYYYEGAYLLLRCIKVSNIRILKYLYDKFNVIEELELLLSVSIQYYTKINGKEIFHFLYEKMNNKDIDSIKLLKQCIYSHNIDVFDIIISDSNNCFDKYGLTKLCKYCISQNYENYFYKIINSVDSSYFDGYYDDLLKTTISSNEYETLSLFLLNKNEIIKDINKQSFKECLELSIYCNKKLTFNKILDLDFLDISYSNNKLLIISINENNIEFVKLILNNKKLDLSKYDDNFEIINEFNIDKNIFMLLVNILPFRKYLSDEKNNFIKPIYNIKKINRTLDE